MTRPHIEFVQQQQLPWTCAALIPGVPPIEHKMLSRDSGNGGFTALARLRPDWPSPMPMAFESAIEFFVLDGKMTIEISRESLCLESGCYLRVEKAVDIQAILARTQTTLLILTGIVEMRSSACTAGDPPYTYVDTRIMDWEIPWVKGPESGLKIKLLYMDSDCGAYSRLIAADPNWSEYRQEHHDCVEEVYMISGDMNMGDLGTMTSGGYIWRPPLIKHGPMQTKAGGLMFIRTDGPLVNHYS